MKRGYAGRNLGGKVRARSGAHLWLKVCGVYDRNSSLYRGEVEAGALVGVPKPALVANIEWTRDLVTWGARLMTYIDAPAIARDPWAGSRANHVSDRWIEELKAALRSVASQRTERLACNPKHVRALVEGRYGVVAAPLSDWQPAHGDLQWSNVTAPHIVLLDWERWGLAPPGYDVSMLIGYSATDPALVARLERAFADVLSTSAARATHLYVLTQLLLSVESGWLDPRLLEPVRSMLIVAERRLRPGPPG